MCARRGDEFTGSLTGAACVCAVVGRGFCLCANALAERAVKLVRAHPCIETRDTLLDNIVTFGTVRLCEIGFAPYK